MSYTIVCADVLAWAAEYSGPKFHAILTDPSYGLGDHPDIEALLTAWLAGDGYDMGPGFMGKDWDTLPGPRYWAAIREHCHPGAYLFAFGGTRTADLLSVAIRLGGWEKFDEIDHLSWLYGSGFPKSHSIGKAVDREAGAEREVVSKDRGRLIGGVNGTSTNHGRGGVKYGADTITAPATELAAVWEGYGTALKPAHEPILCFRNPKAGTYAENCVATGAGALWIDGARVATGDKLGRGFVRGAHTFTDALVEHGARPETSRWKNGNNHNSDVNDSKGGRWPPNVCLSHTAACRPLGTRRVRSNGRDNKAAHNTGPGYEGGWEQELRQWHADPDGKEIVDDWLCVEGCPVRALGEMSGERKVSGSAQLGKPTNGGHRGIYGGSKKPDQICHNDTGTAARFYPQSDWRYEIEERLAGVTPFMYQAKASRRERDAGLDESFPLGEPPGSKRSKPAEGRKRALGEPRRNVHPTVKPIALNVWLARLLLPPPEYAPRRLLVPFAGSGSEMIGALLAGWDEVVGVEMEPEYVEIAEARCRFWAGWSERGYDDPKAILKEAAKEKKRGPEPQMELFNA